MLLIFIHAEGLNAAVCWTILCKSLNKQQHYLSSCSYQRVNLRRPTMHTRQPFTGWHQMTRRNLTSLWPWLPCSTSSRTPRRPKNSFSKGEMALSLHLCFCIFFFQLLCLFCFDAIFCSLYCLSAFQYLLVKLTSMSSMLPIYFRFLIVKTLCL